MGLVGLVGLVAHAARGGVGSGARLGARWGLAALAACLVATGCGTRVSDARVRTAAGIAGVEVVTESPSPVPAPLPASAAGPTAGAATGQPQESAPAQAAPTHQAPTAGAAGSGSPPAQPATPASPTAAAGGPATGSTVVVGAIGTLSGPVGTIVGDIVKGIQIWAQYINAHGGVNGHVVKLVVGDDGGDPARFNSLAQQMVEQNHAIAFVFTSLGLAPGGNNSYLDGKHVVTFGTEGGLDVAYQDPFVATAVATGHAYADSIINGFAQGAVPAGKTKLAVLTCSDFAACDNFDKEWSTAGTQQGTGFQVVYRARSSITQPDYTSECLAAQQAGATAMIMALDTASVERLAGGCARQGFHPLYGLPDELALPSLAGDPNVDGAIVPSKIAPFIDRSVPGVKAIYDAYAQFAPGASPSGASLTGWTFGQFFAAAAAHLPANPSAQDVVDGLNQIKGNDLGGLTYPLTFTSGQPSARRVCWSVSVVQNKAYTKVPGPTLQCK
ncbi:MAG TPA: ABC transporter substrate-binding protein [Actinomycetota bacterium]|nr:ABC transporter substrate-binding protein [Actinomycetota bacterium]